jgi:hypothetical protein
VTAKCVACAVALLIPLVAGCDADPPPKSPAPSVTLPPSTEALPGSTRPGSRLHLGDKAVITVGLDANRARVGVVVTAVEKGATEDSAVLDAKFGDLVRAQADSDFTPTSPVYFIRGVLINEDGMNGGSYSGPLLDGDLEPGGNAGKLMIIGGDTDIVLPHCTESSSLPVEWNTPGARHEFCRIIFAFPDSVRLSAGNDGDIYWDMPKSARPASGAPMPAPT